VIIYYAPVPAFRSAAWASEKAVIIVADDDPTARTLTQAVLERAGLLVLPAEDGKEALELSRACGNTIEAVVTDINMPRIDGLQLRNRLSVERPETPVLLVSADAEPPDPSTPFLRKPWTAPMLLATVHQLVGARLDSSAPLR
jgi:CheY-like chemotaxis protein